MFTGSLLSIDATSGTICDLEQVTDDEAGCRTFPCVAATSEREGNDQTRVIHAVDQAPGAVTRANDPATTEGAGIDDTLGQVWVVVVVAHKYRRLIG